MDKSPDAFRTISEVADHLDTPAHVRRFWESRFPQIRPVKRAGGRRYYRPTDVALLLGIRRLLHDEGMTIRGVQKVLREQGVRHVAALGGSDTLPEAEEAVDAVPAMAPAKSPPPSDPSVAAPTAPSPAPAAAAPVSAAAEMPLFSPPAAPAGEEEVEPQPDPEPAATFAASLRALSQRTLRDRAGKLIPAIARLAELRERLAERGRVPRR